jgi:hypothetical protein
VIYKGRREKEGEGGVYILPFLSSSPVSFHVYTAEREHKSELLVLPHTASVLTYTYRSTRVVRGRKLAKATKAIEKRRKAGSSIIRLLLCFSSLKRQRRARRRNIAPKSCVRMLMV